MPLHLDAAEAFSAWLHLRLEDDEESFDEDLLEHCELQILEQEITSDLIAVQVATVISANMADGEANGGHVSAAMKRLITFMGSRVTGSLPLTLVERVLGSPNLSGPSGLPANE